MLVVVAYFAYMEYLSWHKSAPAAAISQSSPVDDNAEATADSSVSSAQPMPEAALPLAERQAEEVAASAAGAAAVTGNADTAVQSPSAATNVPTGSGANSATTSSSTAIKMPEDPAQAASAIQAAATPAAASTVVKVKQEAAMPLLKLQLVLNEQSWVSVVDRDGKQVLNKTAAAGSREQVEAYPPLKVIIGNASGSQLIFQGKAIDLTPYTRLNVARLTLALE